MPSFRPMTAKRQPRRRDFRWRLARSSMSIVAETRQSRREIEFEMAGVQPGYLPIHARKILQLERRYRLRELRAQGVGRRLIFRLKESQLADCRSVRHDLKRPYVDRPPLPPQCLEPGQMAVDQLCLRRAPNLNPELGGQRLLSKLFVGVGRRADVLLDKGIQ